jgi:hypothetical protein
VLPEFHTVLVEVRGGHLLVDGEVEVHRECAHTRKVEWIRRRRILHPGQKSWGIRNGQNPAYSPSRSTNASCEYKKSHWPRYRRPSNTHLDFAEFAQESDRELGVLDETELSCVTLWRATMMANRGRTTPCIGSWATDFS